MSTEFFCVKQRFAHSQVASGRFDLERLTMVGNSLYCQSKWATGSLEVAIKVEGGDFVPATVLSLPVCLNVAYYFWLSVEL